MIGGIGDASSSTYSQTLHWSSNSHSRDCWTRAPLIGIESSDSNSNNNSRSNSIVIVLLVVITIEIVIVVVAGR